MSAIHSPQGMMFLTAPTNRINKFLGPRLNVELIQRGNILVWRFGVTELRLLTCNRLVWKRAPRLYPGLHASSGAEEADVARRALDVIGGGLDVASYYLGWQEAQNNAYHEQTNPAGCIQLGLSENQVGPGTELTLLNCFGLFVVHQSTRPNEVNGRYIATGV